ncbi:MAG: translocation/assembly module TamB domain-containing protein [Desulforhopalus sp.]
MKRIAFFFGSVFILLSVFITFLFTTETGLGLIQQSINQFGEKTVSIGEVNGRLFGKGSFKNIHLTGTDADIRVEQIGYSWKPGSLFKGDINIPELHVNGVEIILKNGQKSTPIADAADSHLLLPDDLFPFSVLVKSLLINKLKIRDSDNTELFVADTITAGFEGNPDRLTVGNLSLQGPDVGLELQGNIEVSENWSLDLLGNWQFAGFGFHPMAGTFSTKGPLNDPHLELSVHSPSSIIIKADLLNLLSNPEWRATLEAENVDLATLIEDCPHIDLAMVSADLAGDLESYRGNIQAKGSWEELDEMDLVSDLSGDFLGINFQTLRIDRKGSSAQVEGGEIAWRDIFSWKGRFLFKNVNPAIFYEDLQGQLTAELVSEGEVKENGVVASFDILSMDGVLRDHNVSVAGAVFLTETDVTTDGLTFRSGEVTGLAHIETGLFSWAEHSSWSGKIHLENFDPSWLYPEFPGSVNGEFETEGKYVDDRLTGFLNIQKISGTLRGHDLSGGGKISLVDDTFNTTGLVLKSGLTELVVNGQAGESLGLEFSLTSPDIGSILPEGNGSITVKGKLKGSSDEPRLEAELKATSLNYRENSLGSVRAKINGTLAGDGQLNGTLVGEKITLAGYAMDKGSIKLEGTLVEHQIEVDGAGSFGKITFRADGGYINNWNGEVSRFQWRSKDYGVWAQEEKTAVTAGKDGVLLKRFCLSDKESVVCVEGEVQLGEELLWAVNGNLTSMPLNWVNRLDLISLPISGLVSADIAVKGDSHRVLSIEAESRVSTADVLIDVDDTQRVPLYFDDSVLTLELNNGLLQGNINVLMRDGSQLILNAEIEGAGEFSTSMLSLPLQGNLELKKFNLSSLSAFTGYGVEPTGWVSNYFTFAGTVGQPQIFGELKVRDGGIYLPYQGITLENIDISLDAGEDVAHITGTATSGPGKITAAGTIQYGKKGVEGKLDIQGEEFLAVNLPEYVFKVNPDIQLFFNNDRGEIKGTVDIPYGLITPEEMTDSISASEDVIFVNEKDEGQRNGWPFRMDIGVRLGDDVRIDGYGLEGKLVGKLRINTTADESLAGRGELDLVDGTFSIYSRSLNIERGRILFTGGPIDNPGVDVRAQMKVSDEEARGAGYTVGVDISGLVQDLEYHLFSDPYMADAEILSQMIVGHSLADSTQTEGNMLEAAAVMLGVKGSSGFVEGIGSFLRLDDLHLEGSSSKENVSLVLGKRVTKDLYIGYDLNMFSQLGQFRVRYDLTRGFSVETTNSSESTGADLLYTFER